MFLLIALVLSGACLWALRSESVRWQYAIPFCLVPIALAFLLGIFGVLVGGIYLGALWKLNLSGLS